MVLEDQATFSERAFLENYHRPRNMGAECEARVFVPVVDTTYTLSQAEQERLMRWINTLSLGVLS